MIRYLIITISLLASCVIQAKPLLASEQWQTENGSRVVFYRADEVPMVNFNIAFKAGSAFDDKAFGLSTLTTELLNQGSDTLDATQIAERLAHAGAQYGSETKRDMVSIELKSLAAEPNLTEAVDTLGIILGKPAFKYDAFNQKKNQQLMAITQLHESPVEVAKLLFFEKLYQQHPYAHSVLGTATTVKNITQSQVINFYKHYFVASNAIIVIVGAIDSHKAHSIAESLSNALPTGKNPKDIPEPTPLPSAETAAQPFPSTQTVLMLGQIGMEYNDPDYFPLQVGNYSLGGGVLVSQLAIEVREKRGLTYGITSQFVPGLVQGPFLIMLSTKNDQAQQALSLTKDVLKEFLAIGPSEEELQAAQQYMIGNFPLSLSGNGNIADILLKIAFYNLPADYLDSYISHIKAVTRDDIKKAFTKRIHPEQLLTVAVGKQ